MPLIKYTYYDTPDGHDLVKKLIYTNKQVSIIGFGLATSEIILISKPFGYLNTLYRYSQLMTPMFAATSTFCIVTHLATNIRGKDDEKNYAIGGFCAGAIVGPIIKNNVIGFVAAVTCAVIGIIKKNSKVHNYELLPTFPESRKAIHGDFRSVYRNWTLYEQRPKGWIAAEDRKE
ncbi:Hypothetical protein CINCED_3A002063 [Cinara cedri]|nr:Hypothetical protein CINCED_3A002063 [Cinara cedri]